MSSSYSLQSGLKYPPNYDPHKKYVRVGECLRCGRCCDLHCEHIKWVANRSMEAGEVFSDTGVDGPIMFICTADPKPESCANFPTSPAHTPAKCGYSWIEASNL